MDKINISVVIFPSGEKELERFKRFLRFSGKSDSITKKMVIEFINFHKNKNSYSYTRSLKTVIKNTIIQTLHVISASELIILDWERFFKSIHIPKPNSAVTRDQLFSQGDINSIVNREENPQKALIILFLYATGLRNSEARNVKLIHILPTIEVINGKKILYNYIRVFGKNKKYRSVPVDPHLIRLIKTTLKPKEYLFESKLEKKFSERQIQRIVKETTFKHLKRNAWPHLFRHSHGTKFYEETRDIIQGARHMGHSPAIHAKYYVKLSEQDLSVIPIFSVNRITEANTFKEYEDEKKA